MKDRMKEYRFKTNKEKGAYYAGYDCGVDGPDGDNSDQSLFKEENTRNAWMLGKLNAEIDSKNNTYLADDEDRNIFQLLKLNLVIELIIMILICVILGGGIYVYNKYLVKFDEIIEKYDNPNKVSNEILNSVLDKIKEK